MEKLRILHLDTLERETRTMGEDYAFSRSRLIPEDGTHPFTTRVYWLPPSKANYPYHWHECLEEVFYIIDGEGIVETPQGERSLHAGDVIVCPPTPEGAHRIRNTSSDRTLCYIEFDAIAYPDIAHYPNTGAWGINFSERERNCFFDKEDKRIPYEQVDG